ncbi:hypothetical protein PHSY_005393 [Pseudozyma hubeiensis SY62]|uniref:Uncharacterized protein n=1 Tax=Pseudozyma hubeiensis (strain SY62) TaxID=1305764 RepID=R9PI94_PSEHS|nr:hypothetical protein PHSY_005393 [Pseudozyma hubeiensis SY62]GAC97805.1 hypothetical protein PHSY_005393 [Pseudozyma hubeiensis SY62]
MRHSRRRGPPQLSSRSEPSEANKTKAKQSQGKAVGVHKDRYESAGERFGYHFACICSDRTGSKRHCMRLAAAPKFQVAQVGGQFDSTWGSSKSYLLSASNAEAFAKECEAESFAFGRKGGPVRRQICQTQIMPAIHSGSPSQSHTTRSLEYLRSRPSRQDDLFQNVDRRYWIISHFNTCGRAQQRTASTACARRSDIRQYDDGEWKDPE